MTSTNVNSFSIFCGFYTKVDVGWYEEQRANCKTPKVGRMLA